MWDAHASRYGAQERHERRAIDAAVRIAAVRPDDTVVDLATGTGAVLRALAAGGDARPAVAIGVDRSPQMLSRVGALPAGWSTSKGDARCVPLPDGVADVVICSYLLHLLAPSDRLAVLAEARRLLRPGVSARLVLSLIHI